MSSNILQHVDTAVLLGLLLSGLFNLSFLSLLLPFLLEAAFFKTQDVDKTYRWCGCACIKEMKVQLLLVWFFKKCTIFLSVFMLA